MGIDSTGIESQIDSNLPDNSKRRIDASVIRFILKAAVRWVRDAVNGNLSTWIRSSDNTPGGANNDDVYRTGVTRFKGSIEAYTRTPDNKRMGIVGNDLAAMRISAQNGGPAYIELHHPSVRIDKIGTNPEGILLFAPWGVPADYPIVIDGLTKFFRLTNDASNRKLVLFDATGNDHQFFGLGINSGTLRYQVDAESGVHAFYAGSSPATSRLLMTILGNGNVGIGKQLAAYPLDVIQDNPTSGIVAQFQNTHGANGSNGAMIQFHQAGVAIWRIGQPAAFDAFVINGWGNGAYPEWFRIDAAGRVGVGTDAPSAKLHAKSANGFDQLRLETKYTPTGPNDPNGQPGAYAWDDVWFYLKTTVGWRRIQLQSW